MPFNIYNEDCITGCPKYFRDNSVDLIVCDPPFGINESKMDKHYNRENLKVLDGYVEAPKDYFQFSLQWLTEAKRILKKNGNIFIYTHHRHFGDYYKWLDENFDRVFFFVWHKTNPVPQVRKVSFLSSCELCICAWNVGHKWNFKTQNEMHNFINLPICMGKERTSHSAQKPLRTMTHLIEISTDKGDLVLDPFLGSGTTAVASIQTERNFIGFEIDKEYYNIALERIKSAKSQTQLSNESCPTEDLICIKEENQK